MAVLPSSQLPLSPSSICASAGGRPAPVAAAETEKAGGGPSCRLENCDPAAMTRDLRYGGINQVSSPSRRPSDQTRSLARSGTKKSLLLLTSPRSYLDPLTLHLGAARHRQTVALHTKVHHQSAAPPAAIIPLRRKLSRWSARIQPAVLVASPRRATRAMTWL